MVIVDGDNADVEDCVEESPYKPVKVITSPPHDKLLVEVVYYH